MKAVTDSGMNVPKDVSVIEFDVINEGKYLFEYMGGIKNWGWKEVAAFLCI